jgi:DNA-binding XRE family transcriptional regulator
MTPADLKAWRLRLGLTQAEAAQLLGVGERTYQRHEEGMIRGVFRHHKILPGYVDPAAYGVGAAFDKAECLLEVSDWPRGPRRFWNTTLSEEGWYARMLFAVARRILRRGDLTGHQRVSYPGVEMSITFPPDCDNQARCKHPTRRKASAPDP